MSQSGMIQSALQIEAAREFCQLVRPAIQRIVHRARHLRSAHSAPAAPQPIVADQHPESSPIGSVRVQES